MGKRAANILWSAVGIGLLALLAFNLVGCQAAPRTVALPSTAAVRAPVVAAQTHVTRSVDLGRQETAILTANAKGLSAAQVQQVSALVAADASEKAGAQNQLTAALYQAGSLQKELDARQAQVDALAKHDAAQTALATARGEALVKANHARHWWMLAFALSLVADFFAGHLIERYLRGFVETCWRVIGTGYHFVAGALKAAFPLYTFWLPA